ncbi:hypothetical protein L7F22_063458 [Adiantum nelumboides]|nr:hypothetical protein [Adiantum nelumboides]
MKLQRMARNPESHRPFVCEASQRMPASPARPGQKFNGGGTYATWTKRQAIVLVFYPRPNRTSRVVRVLASASQVPGMDASSYQGNVYWAATYCKGARFAYVKATEGTSYVNPYFAHQYNGAYRVGMIWGAYHFARLDKSGGAILAKYFLAHGGRWSRDGKTLPGALDLEGGCRGLTQRRMAAWIAAFISTYHSTTGVDPVLVQLLRWSTR